MNEFSIHSSYFKLIRSTNNCNLWAIIGIIAVDFDVVWKEIRMLLFRFCLGSFFTPFCVRCQWQILRFESKKQWHHNMRECMWFKLHVRRAGSKWLKKYWSKLCSNLTQFQEHAHLRNKIGACFGWSLCHVRSESSQR